MMDNTLKKIDDGLWEDPVGNHYYEETVLRYRVFEIDRDRAKAGWGLYSSHTTKDAAEKQKAICEREDNKHWCDYKVVDAGEETTIKRLVY